MCQRSSMKEELKEDIQDMKADLDEIRENRCATLDKI